ncbi:hydroxymyristoyl-ACP dehydratase [Frateuria aurantia]
MANASYRAVRTLPGEHPCLPGHFPQGPVVPGVLLLEWLAEALRDSGGLRLQRIGQLKYLHPWLPDRAVELRLYPTGTHRAFELWDGEKLLARGQAEAVA